MAVFYDPGQRPLFRDPAAFDVKRVRRNLSECVHVHLSNALRYTRPVFCFLKGLQSETTAPLVNELRHRGRLLEGPDVELHQAQEGKAASKVGEIVTRWIADGFCRADEILILSPHGEKSRSGLAGREMIGAWKLADYEQKAAGPGFVLVGQQGQGAGFTGRDSHRPQTFSRPGRRAGPDGLFHGGQSCPPAAGGGALRPADLTSCADGRGDEICCCRMTRAPLLKGPPFQTHNCEFGRACVLAAAGEPVPHGK